MPSKPPGGNPFEGANTFGSGEQMRAEAERIGGHLSKYVDLSVGRVEVKAEGIQRELLAALNSKPDHRDLLSLRNWLIGTIVATALAVLGLIYTFMMNGDDRAESAIAQGMEVGRALGEQGAKIERLDRDVRDEAKPDQSPSSSGSR